MGFTHNRTHKWKSPDDRDELLVCSLGFKGVGYVRIVASPELSPEDALAMAEQVISMMRTALATATLATKETENGN